MALLATVLTAGLARAKDLRDGVPKTAAGKAAEAGLEPFLGEPKFDPPQTLFRGERMPNVVVTTDGTVLAVWGDVRAGRGTDATTRNNVRVRRSEDGGNTWGPHIGIGRGLNAGGVTVDERSGSVFVFIEKNTDRGVKPPPLTVYRSTDDGKTWHVQDVTIRPDKNGIVPAMLIAEHGITLRHGEYAGRLLRPSRSYAPSSAREHWPQHYNNAVYSDDGGKTWHASDPFPAFGTGEGAVAELSDGRIYYNSRRHWAPEGETNQMRHVAFSDDGGHTWKDLSVSEVLYDGGGYGRGYGLMGGLVRLPVRGQNVLLFSNADTQGGDRTHMTVWASFDAGRTWPVKRLVYEGPSAYSSLAAGRPETPSEGWIYLWFEGGEEHRYDGGQIARFNLSWLIEGEPTGDGEPPRRLGSTGNTGTGK